MRKSSKRLEEKHDVFHAVFGLCWHNFVFLWLQRGSLGYQVECDGSLDSWCVDWILPFVLSSRRPGFFEQESIPEEAPATGVWFGGQILGSRRMWAKLVAKFLLSQLRHWAWLSGSLFCRWTTGIKGFEGKNRIVSFFLLHLALWGCRSLAMSSDLRGRSGCRRLLSASISYCKGDVKCKLSIMLEMARSTSLKKTPKFNPASQAFSTVLKKTKVFCVCRITSCFREGFSFKFCCTRAKRGGTARPFSIVWFFDLRFSSFDLEVSPCVGMLGI